MSSFKFQEGATTEDTVKMLLEGMNWLMSRLDSKNVGRLDTNETVIKSKNGETHISGPLLLMHDAQGTPVLRLKMGYDAASTNFVHQLMNAAGEITVSLDSNGDLVVERGTFKGSITIGTGDNVFKADSNGIYLGNAVYADAPFRVSMAGGARFTNLTVIGGSITGGTITGGTFRTSLPGNVRIEITDSGIVCYNADDEKDGVEIGVDVNGLYSRLSFWNAGVYSGGVYVDPNSGRVVVASAEGRDIELNSDANIFLYGTAPYTGTIADADKELATHEWVESQIVGGTGSFTTVDGKTVTVINGLVTAIV
jgi:hypothetical protein